MVSHSPVIEGWYLSARRSPSPNFNARPLGQPVRLVVVHNISLPPREFGGPFIEQFFLNQLNPATHPYFETIADLQVSAHCLIRRDGEIVQFVSFDNRAWHAGRSSYMAVPECNDYSIGIELEGTDDQPFTEAQYASLVPLIHSIHCAYPESRNHSTGHSDVAIGRKTDPGLYFDWQRLRQGLRDLERG